MLYGISSLCMGKSLWTIAYSHNVSPFFFLLQKCSSLAENQKGANAVWQLYRRNQKVVIAICFVQIKRPSCSQQNITGRWKLKVNSVIKYCTHSFIINALLAVSWRVSATSAVILSGMLLTLFQGGGGVSSHLGVASMDEYPKHKGSHHTSICDSSQRHDLLEIERENVTWHNECPWMKQNLS